MEIGGSRTEVLTRFCVGGGCTYAIGYFYLSASAGVVFLLKNVNSLSDTRCYQIEVRDFMRLVGLRELLIC